MKHSILHKVILIALMVISPMGLRAVAQAGDSWSNSILNQSEKSIIIQKTYTAAVNTPTLNAYIPTVTYFNSLGSPIQQIAAKSTPSQKDVITIFEQDFLFRDTKEYLPYANNANNGYFVSGAVSAQSSYYGSSRAFVQNNYESSALGRVIHSSIPGISAGTGTDYSYLVNSAADNVFKITLGSGGAISIASGNSAKYAAGMLYRNVTVDADGHKVESFVNSTPPKTTSIFGILPYIPYKY